MSLLRNIEGRIASLVEGAFGRAFKTNVQPVELARRLVREMDEAQHVSVRRIFVPNVYDVYLAPEDHAQFSEYESALRNELGEYLAEHARRSGYSVFTRPRVTFHLDEDLPIGSFGIAAKMVEAPEGSAPPPATAPPAPAKPAAAVPVTPMAPPAGGAGETAVIPRAAAPSLTLVTPDGRVSLDTGRLTLGRGKSNDVTLHDASVSREHAEIVRDGDGWKVRDLGSTNGVKVNGTKAAEHAIGAGDVILLGNAQLKVDGSS
jgi:hypothetical protein